VLLASTPLQTISRGFFILRRFGMNFLEKDLEEIIFTADRELLKQRGLCIEGHLKRQKKIGKYGKADLIEIKRPYFHYGINKITKGEIIVYELKKENISVSTFLQALGYLKGIKRYLEKRGKDKLFNYSIIIIGKKIDIKSSFCYLSEFINYGNDADLDLHDNSKFSLKTFTYYYKVDGVYFNEEEGFKQENEGF
jgi:hypothetical protein